MAARFISPRSFILSLGENKGTQAALGKSFDSELKRADLHRKTGRNVRAPLQRNFPSSVFSFFFLFFFSNPSSPSVLHPLISFLVPPQEKTLGGVPTSFISSSEEAPQTSACRAGGRASERARERVSDDSLSFCLTQLKREINRPFQCSETLARDAVCA